MLGGISTNMCTWSGHISASTIFTPFLLHNILKISAISCLIFPYATFLLYFGAKTIWYLQFHFVCDKLLLSIWIPPVYISAVGEPTLIIPPEVFFCKLKQCWLTCIAGGLFVFQSSVFRISEKLHNGKQGFALTIKREPDITSKFDDAGSLPSL